MQLVREPRARTRFGPHPGDLRAMVGPGDRVARDGTHPGTFEDGLRRHLREPPCFLTLRSGKVRTASPREAIIC